MGRLKLLTETEGTVKGPTEMLGRVGVTVTLGTLIAPIVTPFTCMLGIEI
ncbi:hypothetical protein [Mycobacterium riyadhense]